MPFYKKETGNDTLLQGTSIYNAGSHLTEENHGEFQYPREGWYWFENLDVAMSFFVNNPNDGSVTPLQGMRAINQFGMAAAFQAWISSLDPVTDFETLAYFQKASRWERDNEFLIAGATALGLTSAQIAQMFDVAKGL